MSKKTGNGVDPQKAKKAIAKKGSKSRQTSRSPYAGIPVKRKP